MADAVFRLYMCLVFMFVRESFALSAGNDFNSPLVEVIILDMGATQANYDDSGTLVISSNNPIKVRLFGTNFTNTSKIAFTAQNASRGAECENLGISPEISAHSAGVNPGNTAQFTVSLGNLAKDQNYFFLCVKEASNGEWIHQGDSPWVRLKTAQLSAYLLPIWLQIMFICGLLCLSGLFSGLNLGLMALDKTELKIIENCGSVNEKKYAKLISPIRQRGNFLLCTLLLGNVLVNNTLTILLDDLSNGLLAVFIATFSIVIFGEIIPQAICSRHGLAVGAKTIWVTRTFMVLTFVLSFPISLILDKILGEEIGQVYNREKLQELIRVTRDMNDLENDEMNIISGALELSKKTVKDVMTRIEDVFMIEHDAMLDFDAVSNIMKSGFTRIPIYQGSDRTNIVALLNTKDLAFVDPDDKIPLKTVCKFYNRRLEWVFEDQKLGSMLQDFRQGRSHMAIIQRVNSEGEGDPFYETIGLLTLEDVIEEIIQSEILDETDAITDNRRKMPRKLEKQDFSIFNQPDEQHMPRLSPQLALAAFQYLSTAVDAFKPELISDTVLRKLFEQNIVINMKVVDMEDPCNFIYREGTHYDFFVLILQGRVEVTVGKEHLLFDGGPFSFYGLRALLSIKESIFNAVGTDKVNIKSEPFIPDYSTKALCDLQFLRITCAQYIAARRATILNQSKHHSTCPEDAFAKELKMIKANCHCSDPDTIDKMKGTPTLVDKSRTNSVDVMFEAHPAVTPSVNWTDSNTASNSASPIKSSPGAIGYRNKASPGNSSNKTASSPGSSNKATQQDVLRSPPTLAVEPERNSENETRTEEPASHSDRIRLIEAPRALPDDEGSVDSANEDTDSIHKSSNETAFLVGVRGTKNTTDITDSKL